MNTGGRPGQMQIGKALASGPLRWRVDRILFAAGPTRKIRCNSLDLI
jgi:hypothetical protein